MSVTAYRSTASPRRITGRPIAPETPHQRIEGEAYEAATELVLYRDNDQVRRMRADRLCDDAVRRAERALDAGDVLTARAALRDYWPNDADEDEAGQCGDGRVSVAHAHVRCIPAAVVEIEMGAYPATAYERGVLPARRPSGRGRSGR